jgi:hypothetical protein
VPIYVDTIVWLASIYGCARIVAAMPKDLDTECTELGSVICRVAIGTVPLLAFITSARLVIGLLA